jgi:hypothetical protein
MPCSSTRLALSPRATAVRAAWICFVAGLLLITAPLWHAAFESKPL